MSTAPTKEALRPVYQKLMDVALSLGAEVEVAPKKTSVSLRRTRQFALIDAYGRN